MTEAEPDAGKAGSLALKAFPSEAHCVYPADPCTSRELSRGAVLNYPRAGFCRAEEGRPGSVIHSE